MTERLSFFAPCARGIESLLADELRSLGIKGVRPQRAGVLFAGPITHGYRALLWSRLASRVLMRLAELDASSAESLYAGVRDIAWEDHLRADGTVAVDAVGVNEALRNTQFTAVRVKDAVADRFRDSVGTRPSVDTRSPDVRINVAIRAEKATLSLDISGNPLHQRGYREPGVQVAAPMKETLAAAVLAVAGWAELAEAGGAFLDPMCGSGTLAIEAAMIACDIAPGLMRDEWPVERWLGHDAAALTRERERAEHRRATGLADPVPVWASDSDSQAVAVARACLLRAGLDGVVTLKVAQLGEVVPPAGATQRGLVATNPPYGERLGELDALPGLYRDLSTTLGERFAGWRLAIITPDERAASFLGWSPLETHELFNGRISSPVRVFDVRASGAPDGEPTGAATDFPVVAGQQEFANRLHKRHAHLGKWARRTGVTCYRVYDADLPDFNVAIDLYQGAGPDEGRSWVNLSEYAPPAEIDERLANARLEAAVRACAVEFDIEVDDVFVKRRERQRGSDQYSKLSRQHVSGTVAENGLLFGVNLSDYLDTGLFLDHRDTRAWIRELAAGKRFLNLFAYTGSVTTYAVAGGAASSVTVDLSTTYLDWAKRNLARNGLTGAQHTFERADVIEWLGKAAGEGPRFDLIFCDPPTFSNSKRTEATFDVQRDHVELVKACAAVLSDGGTIVFSTNKKRFELDEIGVAAAGLAFRDVTARTIPKDFERTPRVHSCWTLTKA